MKYQISPPKVWESKFAWYPKRIGSIRIWLERYEVRSVPSLEAQDRYPLFPNPFVACWLDEFYFAGQSYWRLTRCPMTAFGSFDYSWVSVKPVFSVVPIDRFNQINANQAASQVTPASGN